MIETLTDRESEVLAHLAEGLTNREIAQRLVLSPETVKWYNKQIYQKLGAGNRTEAVTVGHRYGLLAGDARVAKRPFEYSYPRSCGCPAAGGLLCADRGPRRPAPSGRRPTAAR